MVEDYVEPDAEDAFEGVDEESLQPLERDADAPIWEPAPIAGRYRLGDYLTESRLGRTYRAWDTETDEEVEVTFLDDEAVTDATSAEAWLEELRGLRHLHVLPLLDWEIAPVPYLVSAAPAMRLDRLITAGVPLSPSQTLLIGLQAAETLHDLRRRGITHGALTPYHCCVDANGRLRLAELGVDFLRAPLEPADATRYDAPEAIRAAEDESLHAPAAGAEAPAQPVEFESAETVGAPGPETEDAPGEPDDLTDAGESLSDDAAVGDVSAGDVLAGDVAAGDVAAGDVAAGHVGAGGVVPDDVAAGPDASEPPADVEPSPGEQPAAAYAPAAGDVYGLGLILTEVAAGRPMAPEGIAQLGRAVVPRGAGAATARHLARLAPMLVQATVSNPQSRLEADELALAMRATAEMLPPPARLDEVFQRAGDDRAEPEASEGAVRALEPVRARRRNPLMRIAAAAAVVVAAALLVIYTAGGGGTPSYPVPDVVGLDWTRANDTLTTSGWEVRRLEVRVAEAAAGEVVGQLPEPGGLLDAGQVVKVQVSLGPPLVVVPADIVGLPLEQAGLRLSEMGLAVGTVETRVDPSMPAGSVVAVAEPLPELPRGSPVDLVIAVAR